MNDLGLKRRPFIVGIGGTTRVGSSTERLLRESIDLIAQQGAKTQVFAGPDLCFPHYAGPGVRDEKSASFLSALRACDGIILAAPSYHGSISGMIKNAIDYTEDMRTDERVYFDGLPVGCICCAAGWQAASHTLGAMRSIVHALRGWP
ncbi:MAG: NAD(P)H-dependent oxidoreductase, partial [Pseudolabrys sp.]|nr:NAD(P)H-dependent oxidoreductase [Pseudolabrys sp.]